LLILLGIFFSSFLIGLSGAMMPGPLLTVAVAESYKKGFWAGPFIVIGHGIPELILAVFLATIVGFKKVFKNRCIVGIIGVIGGIFLLVFGLQMLVEVIKERSLSLESKGEIGLGPFLAGIFVSVSNPGWIIWWATIGMTYITKSLSHGIVGLAFFYSGHILSDFLWYSSVSYLVSKGKSRFSKRFYKLVLLFASVLMLGLALFFVVNGIMTLVKYQ